MRDLDADLSLDSGDDNRKLVNVNQDQDQGQPFEGLPRPRSEVNNSSAPPSRASPQPPTSGFQSDGDLFGPPTSSSIGNTHTVTNSTSTIANRRTIVNDDDEEENLWKQLEEANTQQSVRSQQQPASMQFSGDLDDEEMWATLDAASTSIKPAAGINSAGADEMDIDDEDIWDIVKENEKTPPPSSGGEESNPTIPIHANQSLSESELGWDDMYAD
jgi:replication fork protection complex subunit Csm3/Swi3